MPQPRGQMLQGVVHHAQRLVPHRQQTVLHLLQPILHAALIHSMHVSQQYITAVRVYRCEHWAHSQYQPSSRTLSWSLLEHCEPHMRNCARSLSVQGSSKLIRSQK